jgi:hypothetical protein
VAPLCGPGIWSGWFGPNLFPSKPQSLCDNDRVLTTVKRLIASHISKTYGRRDPEVERHVSHARVDIMLNGIRHRGFVNGNDGSQCAALVKIFTPGLGWYMGEFSADYSIEPDLSGSMIISVRVTSN